MDRVSTQQRRTILAVAAAGLVAGGLIGTQGVNDRQTVTERRTVTKVESTLLASCSEIGRSFRVVPGSDPRHDADADGVACESY